MNMRIATACLIQILWCLVMLALDTPRGWSKAFRSSSPRMRSEQGAKIE